ncbi:MAG TPA: hypothetical protein VNO32_50215, partial [Candidatus Acidoferrum sp.]|nr:hypothetical protein [Candidatus Acidoferrum sp.]
MPNKHRLRNTLIGVAVGAGAGAGISAAAWEPHGFAGGRGTGAAVGAVIGAAGGAVVGALTGAMELPTSSFLKKHGSRGAHTVEVVASWGTNTLRTKALATRSVVVVTENRAKRCQVSGRLLCSRIKARILHGRCSKMKSPLISALLAFAIMLPLTACGP